MKLLLKLFFLLMKHSPGAENPTYLKTGTIDQVVVAVALSGLAIGVTCILNGLYNMSNGVNKKK